MTRYERNNWDHNMNEAKGIERSFAVVLREFGDLGSGTVVRCWQSLQEDWMFKINPIEGERKYPCVDLRATPPRMDNDQHTRVTALMIEIATHGADDRNHQQISGIYESVKETLDRMFTQFLSGTDGDELKLLKAQLLEDVGSDFHFGGLSFGEPLAPYDDDGINSIGMEMRVHHARTDY
jgi:hypothetical protein